MPNAYRKCHYERPHEKLLSEGTVCVVRARVNFRSEFVAPFVLALNLYSVSSTFFKAPRSALFFP